MLNTGIQYNQPELHLFSDWPETFYQVCTSLLSLLKDIYLE